MPESSKRKEEKKKVVSSSPKGAKKYNEERAAEAENPSLLDILDDKPKVKHSPRWYAPLFVTLMVIGLVWVVVAYISGGAYPIPHVSNGNYNLFAGLGVMVVGFLMTAWWK
ncbi:MAG: cell division protein CrgA [Actinomycetaceae bacterium]|nr:cell division protein CrgA [Actinomycetaceae bacterium]